MEELIKRIKELGFDEYSFVVYEGKSYVVVFMGYGYYRETDKENYHVSPYYFASNKAYFASKELEKYIRNKGYFAAVRNHIVYDEILEKCGAIRGKNNLFYVKGIGSLYCVHIIETDMPTDEKKVEGPECTNCNRCVKACPMSALTGKGIKADLCLRERMDNVEDELCRSKISTLLGCDICQKVCPNNNQNIVEKTYPQFNKIKILSGDVKDLAELVGKNMARKQRLQFQAMCISTNKKEKDKAEIIDKIDGEKLNKTRLWSLNSLKNID